MIKMHNYVYREFECLHRQIELCYDVYCRLDEFLISHHLLNSLFSSSNFLAMLVSTLASRVFVAFSMKALEPCSLLSSIFPIVVSRDLTSANKYPKTFSLQISKNQILWNKNTFYMIKMHSYAQLRLPRIETSSFKLNFYVMLIVVKHLTL